MVITDYLERNARLFGGETALVEINPSERLPELIVGVDGRARYSAKICQDLMRPRMR